MEDYSDRPERGRQALEEHLSRLEYDNRSRAYEDDIQTGQPQGSSSWVSRFFLWFVMGLVAVMGVFLVRKTMSNVGGTTNPPAKSDLVDSFFADPESIELELRTSEANEARIFLDRKLGWKIDIPDLKGSELLGVGQTEVMRGVSLPSILYRTGSGQRIPVFVLNYSFLDKHERVLSLKRDILIDIENPGSFWVEESASANVVSWRVKDDIFIAVTTEEPDDIVRSLSG